MAWVRRGRQLVYYRSRRVGRRVARDYFSGPEARLAAALDEARRARRRAEAGARQAERGRLDGVLGPLARFCCLADLMARAVLLASGYYRHGGEWRRRGTYGHDHRPPDSDS
jgi:hypothetical protein